MALEPKLLQNISILSLVEVVAPVLLFHRQLVKDEFNLFRVVDLKGGSAKKPLDLPHHVVDPTGSLDISSLLGSVKVSEEMQAIHFLSVCVVLSSLAGI